VVFDLRRKIQSRGLGQAKLIQSREREHDLPSYSAPGSERVPAVTIAVVTKSGEEPPYLASLMSQNFRGPFEILVAQGGNRSQAKNAAISKARATLIAFIDSDCEADDDWVSNLVSHLPDDPSIAGVGGVSKRSPDSDQRWQYAIDAVFSTFLGSLNSASLISVPSGKMSIVKAISGHNSLFRRNALVEVGGFDDRFELNEDTEICGRLAEHGYKLRLDRSLYVHHRRRSDPLTFARQFFWYGVGRARSMLTDKRYADLRVLSFFFGAIVSCVLVIMLPALAFVIGAAYLAAILLSSVIGAWRVKSRPSPLVPPLFLVEHFSYFAGMFVGLSLGPWRKPREPKPIKVERHLPKGND
jgi:succinoglycan biosynthesis protein ExoA